MAISVGLVGYGHSARYLHAPFVRSAGMRIKAVVSSRRQEISSHEPDALILDQFDDLLSLSGPDLIVLATPNELHFDQAVAALHADRHVVVDKPFTLTSKEASRLIDIANRRGLILSCYHNRRWDSDFLTVRKVVAGEMLGKVFTAHMRWDRFRVQVRDRWRERPGKGAGALEHDNSHPLLEKSPAHNA